MRTLLTISSGESIMKDGCNVVLSVVFMGLSAGSEVVSAEQCVGNRFPRTDTESARQVRRLKDSGRIEEMFLDFSQSGTND